VLVGYEDVLEAVKKILFWINSYAQHFKRDNSDFIYICSTFKSKN
jgi:hypothetical protein